MLEDYDKNEDLREVEAGGSPRFGCSREYRISLIF